MRSFDIPATYRSRLTGRLKQFRKDLDPRKKDLSPITVDLGNVRFHFARHFGFCYGVENAIEISYRALEENPEKRIFLLSQMIHNPAVNADLQAHGMRFIQDTEGNMLMDRNEVTADDVVIIPAFGTTLETEQWLKDIGVDTMQYNTTCPFVEKVWKRSAQLGAKDCTVVIHGKDGHEETRATFSHTKQNAPAVVVRDMEETLILGRIISGEEPAALFEELFRKKSSEGFDVKRDLQQIGVVNQTTMLASETQAIAQHLRDVMLKKYGEASIKEHFADTRDTLCYATNDNQQATHELLKIPAHVAIVVGGYNSSNTSHIVELCEQHFPTYFINSAKEITEEREIGHFNIHDATRMTTKDWLPMERPLDVVLTSGASCPDTLVDAVMLKVAEMVGTDRPVDEVIEAMMQPNS